MFCTPSERIEIGRRVFAHELAKKEAAAEYGVAEQSIYQYVREYLKSAGLPPYSRMQLKWPAPRSLSLVLAYRIRCIPPRRLPS